MREETPYLAKSVFGDTGGLIAWYGGQGVAPVALMAWGGVLPPAV